ncbi:MAG: peptidylprolyl isomerase [Acidimicrobiaceae bacterium]|nr:peptidylprolyl isomerase [Acidimicrobiaceae bacterium]
MSSTKRERQRLNRLKGLEAAEAARKKADRKRRIIIIATAVALLLIGVFLATILNNDNGSDADSDNAELDAATPEQPRLSDDHSSDNTTTTIPSDTEDTTTTTLIDNTETNIMHADCPPLETPSEPKLAFDAPPPNCIDPSKSYTAVFDTSEGVMRFQLHTQQVPMTVNNFVALSRWGYYNNTLLFRTDPSIDIIQGGSPHTNSPADPGPGYTIPDEPAFDLNPSTGELRGPYTYEPGQIVMARSAGIDSAGAQFFLTTGPNTALLNSQGTYVVFGTTDSSGLEVAQSIIGLHVDTGSRLGGAPSRDVIVHSITIIEETLPAN